jgi:hypothetical protein
VNRSSLAKLFVALAVTGISISTVTAKQKTQNVLTPTIVASPFYFPNIDINRDGFISRSELPKELNDLRTHFDEYAFDDHRLSKREYVQYLKTIADARCGHSDTMAFTGCGKDPYAMTEGP